MRYILLDKSTKVQKYKSTYNGRLAISPTDSIKERADLATKLSGPSEVECGDMRDYSSSSRGLDSKGRRVTHHTYYNPRTNRRISYDTYEAAWGEVYVQGSGHEVDQDTNQKFQWRIDPEAQD